MKDKLADQVLKNLNNLNKTTNESRLRHPISENDSVDMCVKVGNFLKWKVNKSDPVYGGAASASKEEGNKRMVICSYDSGELQLCLEDDEFEPIDNTEINYKSMGKFFQDPAILGPFCLAALEKARKSGKF
jgi:hypothetical protein